MVPENATTEVVVPEGAAERLDRFLATSLGLSRARVRAVIEAGLVRVDGRRARKGDPVRPGQRVEVRAQAPEAAVVPEPDAPLVVLLEDDAIVVLDKQPGIPVHPLEPGERGTLANALVARYPECLAAGGQPRECGFAHRLDTGTSGVIVAARTPAAWLSLRQGFKGRTVEKLYLALVGGALGDQGEMDAPIANDPDDPRRVVVCGSESEASRLGAEPALTRYRVRERFGSFPLAEVEIVTGVRHQIRAHLASIGAPVVGDALYGGVALPGLTRPFLHASRLAFSHPVTGRRVVIESPLPADLRQCLDGLRADPTDEQ